ncbi:hypothetical protein FO059_04475 [Tomitella fengzijianii]|uniref:Uncharacterized protein n=1 Tax=Tomitella fengzijianii TaxID=2597660 RepID=A0A516X7I1_9ACTN|nr:hypothetical protein FO059_04475 [Tomitella fengzijianii]
MPDGSVRPRRRSPRTIPGRRPPCRAGLRTAADPTGSRRNAAIHARARGPSRPEPSATCPARPSGGAANQPPGAHR